MAQKIVKFICEINSCLLNCVGLDDRIYFKLFDLNCFVGQKRYNISKNLPTTSIQDLLNVELLSHLPCPRRTVTTKLYDLETCIRFVATKDQHKANLLRLIFLEDASLIYSLCTGQKNSGVYDKLSTVSVLSSDHPLSVHCRPMSAVLRNLQNAYGYTLPLLLLPGSGLVPKIAFEARPNDCGDSSRDEPSSKRRRTSGEMQNVSEPESSIEDSNSKCQSPASAVEDQTATLDVDIKRECQSPASTVEDQTFPLNVETQTDECQSLKSTTTLVANTPTDWLLSPTLSRIILTYSNGKTLCFNVQ